MAIPKADAKRTADAFYQCVIARHSCPEEIRMNCVRTIGTSPFRMLYGREPDKLKEIWDKAVVVMAKIAEDTKAAEMDRSI